MAVARVGPSGFAFSALFVSNMAAFNDKLKRAVVGIAGLGGLGSNVAVMLARTGIGTLIIADFDDVEPSNLDRQHYFVDQIGRSKVECMQENLRRIDPGVCVKGHKIKLASANVPEIFADVHVVAECFDKADQKRMIVETVRSRMPQTAVVSASGLAGYGRSNAIQTRRVSERFVLVGDGSSGTDSCPVLTAARVGIAAAHQANAIVELIVDELDI